MVPLESLDEDALVRILVEPKNALTKQYQKLFELEDVGLTFDAEALRAVARKALKRGTGARGLRAILENDDDRHHVRPARPGRRARGRHHPGVDHRGQAAAGRHRAAPSGSEKRRRRDEPPVAATCRRLPAVEPSPIEFVGSAFPTRAPLEPAAARVAFLGRSNVGKSSLLNALSGRRGLARVSGDAGQDQALNVFRLPGLYLVDLPGYGYARAGKGTRATLQKLIRGYIWRACTAGGCGLAAGYPAGAVGGRSGIFWRPWRTGGCRCWRRSPSPTSSPSARAGRGNRPSRRPWGSTPTRCRPTSSTTGLGIADLGASMLAAVPH